MTIHVLPPSLYFTLQRDFVYLSVICIRYRKLTQINHFNIRYLDRLSQTKILKDFNSCIIFNVLYKATWLDITHTLGYAVFL